MFGLEIVIFIGLAIHELCGDKGLVIALFILGFIAIAIGF